MQLTDSLKNLLTETAEQLKGAARLYTRLSAKQVREQLIIQFGYPNQELPTSETIRVKLNQLGYRLRRVAKTKPQKKFLKPMLSLNK